MRRFALIVLSALVNGFLLVRTLFWTFPRLLLDLVLGLLRGETSRCDTAEKPHLLMLSFIEWDGAWQRPQHLATRLAAGTTAPRGVVYCSPVRAHNVRAHNAMGRIGALLCSTRHRESEGLDVVRPLVLPGENRFRVVRFLNDLIVYDALRREIRRQGGPPQILMTNSPFFERVFSLLPARVRIYDAMDELVRFPWAPADGPARERRLAAQCDLIATGTLSLERLKKEQFGDLCPEIRYVACGVDADRFAPRAGDESPPEDIAHLPQPILGFFGAINERVDPDVLETLAAAWPEASIVLVGPVYRTFAESAKRLRAHRNVHFLGPKPYADLPRYLAAFDCALVPYRLTQGIEFVQPVKVLEYLAGGKPVVSTAIPDVAELYGGLVRTADSPEAFVAQAREAAAEGAARAEEYVRVAQGRSWQRMAEDFESLFDKALQDRSATPYRIAHLLHGAHLGGAEEVVMNLCLRHDPARCEAMVICLGEGEIVQRRFEERGIRRRIVPMRGKTDLGVALRLIGVLRAEKIDLVHTHTSRTNLVGRIVSTLVGIPAVTTVHTAVARDINDFGRKNRLNAWVERLTHGVSSRLICVSDRNRREILGWGKVAPERVVHIPNGVADVDPAGFDRARLRRDLGLGDDETRIVGMVASMRPRKGPEVLLRAMATLARDFPDLRLLMVGSGEFVESRDYLATLRDLAHRLEIADRVVFTGHRDDVAALISLMDVFVLPSLFGEGMPLVLLEAMSQGKPLVVSRTEGNDEIVDHGINGFLAAPGSPDALARFVGILLNDPDSARAMGRKGRETFENRYRIEIVAGRYQEVYREVLRRGGEVSGCGP
ncbi:glycosyltransferase [Candidatus Sumerlaeota bacterium]|nr:glycosyltransferase [Candidatus Sumerlaeota bacterium]